MHALVVTVTIHEAQAAQAMLQDQVIPQVSQAPGFVNGYWTRKDDRGSSMIVFESEEAAQSAAEHTQSGGRASDAVSFDDVEVREVVGQA